MKSNIVMIGMPGGGKSTVGVVLAKMLGMDFLDGDLAIIKARGQKLQEIIDECGVEGFLDIEAQVLQGLHCRNTVIATGGSAVLRADTVEHLRSQGALVYLYHPYEEIQERISDLSSRGIAFEKGQSLRQMYDYREPIYRRCADVIVDARGLTITEAATAVIKALRI
ncbi:MAG: shikimate kinase [Oscillospiraceae bacterium]|nr:shikimate kinase [Oscillospiraceae bacterium]